MYVITSLMIANIVLLYLIYLVDKNQKLFEEKITSKFNGLYDDIKNISLDIEYISEDLNKLFEAYSSVEDSFSVLSENVNYLQISSELLYDELKNEGFEDE